MPPKEKAVILVDKYIDAIPANAIEDIDKSIIVDFNAAKNCALIAVDEIINADWFIESTENLTLWIAYWREVKEEIKKL